MQRKTLAFAIVITALLTVALTAGAAAAYLNVGDPSAVDPAAKTPFSIHVGGSNLYQTPIEVSDQKPYYTLTITNHSDYPLTVITTPDNQRKSELHIVIPAHAKDFTFAGCASNSPATDTGRYRVLKLLGGSGSRIDADLACTVAERPML